MPWPHVVIRNIIPQQSLLGICLSTASEAAKLGWGLRSHSVRGRVTALFDQACLFKQILLLFRAVKNCPSEGATLKRIATQRVWIWVGEKRRAVWVRVTRLKEGLENCRWSKRLCSCFQKRARKEGNSTFQGSWSASLMWGLGRQKFDFWKKHFPSENYTGKPEKHFDLRDWRHCFLRLLAHSSKFPTSESGVK